MPDAAWHQEPQCLTALPPSPMRSSSLNAWLQRAARARLTVVPTRAAASHAAAFVLPLPAGVAGALEKGGSRVRHFGGDDVCPSSVCSRLGSIAPTQVGASERDVCVGARPPVAAYPTGGGLGQLRRLPDVRGRRQCSNSGPIRLVPLAANAQPRLAPRSQAPLCAPRRAQIASP